MKRLFFYIISILLMGLLIHTTSCTIVKSDGTYLTEKKNSKYIYHPANRSYAGHNCRWKLCPYKGIKKAEWSAKVTEYTHCNYGQDAHAIDMLHLLKPKWSVDKLHNALLTD